jgi:hypothetical protein
MRPILRLLGVAAIAGLGLLLDLTWAFTPRGPSSSTPPSPKKMLQSGRLDPGRTWSIFESRTAGSSDIVYVVQIAKAQAQGGNVLFVTNSPLPLRLRLIRDGVLEP